MLRRQHKDKTDLINSYINNESMKSTAASFTCRPLIDLTPCGGWRASDSDKTEADIEKLVVVDWDVAKREMIMMANTDVECGKLFSREASDSSLYGAELMMEVKPVTLTHCSRLS